MRAAGLRRDAVAAEASDADREPAVPANDVATSARCSALRRSSATSRCSRRTSSRCRHWDRLLGGVLYATSPRVDWATLLRRSFSVDVLECPKCHGRLRVIAVITEREPVRRILAHLGLPTDPPPLARARDPTDEVETTRRRRSSRSGSRRRSLDRGQRARGERRRAADDARRRRRRGTCALEMLN